ncbi:MAG: metallophosphoesterase [Clostridiaceae bacterium]|jgi:putative phosphoesterase|nr:metallophosphoesterase [Clostridiaceae bacterium]
MVKLLVISDSHGNTSLAEKVISNHRDVDMVIHLGDYFRDARKLEDLFPQLCFEYVYGNSDFMIGDVPIEKILEIEGQRVLITHGHRYSVKWGTDRLKAKAENENIQLILFGHTHMSQVEHYPGLIILNPGSISDPRGEDDESYAIVSIDNFKIDAKLMNAV